MDITDIGELWYSIERVYPVVIMGPTQLNRRVLTSNVHEDFLRLRYVPDMSTAPNEPNPIKGANRTSLSMGTLSPPIKEEEAV